MKDFTSNTDMITFVIKDDGLKLLGLYIVNGRCIERLIGTHGKFASIQATGAYCCIWV
jgi:hypothetical protein